MDVILFRKRNIPKLGKKWIKELREYKEVRSKELLKWYVIPDEYDDTGFRAYRYSPFGLLCKASHDDMSPANHITHIGYTVEDGNPYTQIRAYKSNNSHSSEEPPAHLFLFLGLSTVDKLDIKECSMKKMSYKYIADIIEWRLMRKERQGYIHQRVREKYEKKVPEIVRSNG